MSDPYHAEQGEIPEPYREILEQPSFGHVATIDPDGWPQVTPVWVDHDDGRAVLINTLEGRRKERNLRRDPRASISVLDPENPYRYLTVRGEVSMTTEGASDHIDQLARKYLDVERYPHHDEEEGNRVIVRIPATRVITRGRSADR